MKDIQEKGVFAVNGWIMVAVDLAVFFFCARYLVTHADRAGRDGGHDRSPCSGPFSSS